MALYLLFYNCKAQKVKFKAIIVHAMYVLKTYVVKHLAGIFIVHNQTYVYVCNRWNGYK